jgi:hypothetical protein
VPEKSGIAAVSKCGGAEYLALLQFQSAAVPNIGVR